MTDIAFFAIRHNPTGKYLPMGPRQNGRGATLREPETCDQFNLPRLFHNRTAAHLALMAWLKGRYEPVYDEGSYWSGEITPVPSRKGEEMEIVPITMQLP